MGRIWATGWESVDKILEGHDALFLPRRQALVHSIPWHLFPTSLPLSVSWQYFQSTVCRLDLEFALGWERWCLALGLLPPILHQLYSCYPAQWPLLRREPFLGTLEHLVSNRTLWHIYANTCLEEKKAKVAPLPPPQIKQTEGKSLNKGNHVLSGIKIGCRVHF